MGKYTKIFNTIEEYNTYYNSSDMNNTIVSLINGEVGVKYDYFKVTSRNITVGRDETITCSFFNGETGQVFTKLNGAEYSASIINGKAKITIPELPAGTYSGVCVYGIYKQKYSFTVKGGNSPIG